MLIVDDVFDTGQTINAIIQTMRTQLKNNLPQDIQWRCRISSPAATRPTDYQSTFFTKPKSGLYTRTR
ncbi:MAG: hypothetical protein CM15mP120_04550 [Pseudomonadota bacterium]|nr:MAG: hypothetical protein CM15mP120_04550 [Pseudomonadota bacterium]